MIISKEVEVKIGNRNYKYYRDLGYKFSGVGDVIFVDIKDLLPTTRVCVLVECDFCYVINKTIYRNYIKGIKTHNLYSCSKCSYKKSELTSLEKYGVSSPSKLGSTKDKSENTNFKKYGFKSSSQNEDVKFKMYKTNMERYGTKLPLQNIDIKNKMIENFIIKYGVDNPSKCEVVKKKREKTMISIFGYKTNLISPKTHLKAIEKSCSKESKEKRVNTNIKRYGVINYALTDEFKIKFKNTNMERYGCEYPAQNLDIFNKTQISQFKIKYYGDIRYQGTYEFNFLKYCEDINILDKISKIKSIKYILNDKEKVYHPDFYIKELNLIIEIKSDYYYNLYLEKNILKEKSCLGQGYDFIFIINKDYTEFYKKITPIF